MSIIQKEKYEKLTKYGKKLFSQIKWHITEEMTLRLGRRQVPLRGRVSIGEKGANLVPPPIVKVLPMPREH